jgi:hypothetical protein
MRFNRKRNDGRREILPTGSFLSGLRKLALKLKSRQRTGLPFGLMMFAPHQAAEHTCCRVELLHVR